MNSFPLKMMLAAGIAALALAMTTVPTLKAASPKNNDIMVQVLGGTADFAAEKAYREADIYFHAGQNEGCEASISGNHKEHHDDDHDSHEAVEQSTLPLMGLIKHLHGESAPKKHRHLEGDEEKEVLPWFIAAVRLNPRHIEAWRTGAYWFYRMGNVPKAEKFIADAISHNPNDYRLYLDQGILEFRAKRWQNAVRSLELAEKYWKNDSEDAPYDHRAIKTFLKGTRERG